MAQMVKKSLQCRKPGFDLWVGKTPWRRDSCLENPKDRGAWRDTVHEVTESDTTKRLALSLSFSVIIKVVFRTPEDPENFSGNL